MAQELPWFRFSPQDWQNGDITLESYELQGLFINVCSYYWIKDCSITLAMLQKRYSNANGMLDQLFNAGILKHDTEDDFIEINFLNDQFDELSEIRKRRQDAGKMGGLAKSSNAKAKLQQCSSYKKRIDKKRTDNKRTEDNINNAIFEKIELCKAHYRKLYEQAENSLHREYITKIITAMVEENMTAVMFKDDHPTYKDIAKWLKDYDIEKIIDTIRAMENSPKYLKNYKTMRLTLNNWIKR